MKALIALAISLLINTGIFYPAAGYVDDVKQGPGDLYTVSWSTSTGIRYTGTTSADDMEIGDFVAVIMQDTGKRGIVTDDTPLVIRYCGFWME